MDSKYQRNASSSVDSNIPTTIWEKTNEEMVGDATYNLNKVAGFFETLPNGGTVNQVRLRVWASNATTNIEYRIFVRNNTSAFNTNSIVADRSGTLYAGSFPITESEYLLNFDAVTLTPNQVFFVFFKATDTTAINHKRWLFNGAITPARHGFAFNTNNTWDSTWTLASQSTGYGQPSLKLLYESLTTRSLRNAKDITYANTTSGLAASTVQSAIDALSNPVTFAPELIVPLNIYGTIGLEMNLYFNNIFLNDYRDYLLDITCTVGTQQEERWTFTPTSAVDTTLTLQVRDKRTTVLVNSVTIGVKVAASTNNAGTKKVMVIGDSLTSANTTTQTLLDIAATDSMAITLLGTLGTAPNKHEGRGGWSIANYTGAGATYYSFTVAGVVTPPTINATEYTHNGSTYRVQQVNLTSGNGTIVCSVISGGAPLATGTLTKSNAIAGDATIVFSASAAVPANPFWISSAINFNQYLINNTITAPDWVIIHLGTNDVFGEVSDSAARSRAVSRFTMLDTLISSIKAINGTVRVGIAIPPTPATSQDAFGANYACGETQWRHKRNILMWAKELLLKYNNQEANRIYVFPINTAIDCVNNFPKATATPVNARNTGVTVARASNGVHPDNSGYKQLGDSMFSLIKFVV